MNFTLTSSAFATYTGTMTVQVAPAVQYFRQPHDVEMLDYNLGDSGRRFMGPGYTAGKVRNNAVQYNKTIPEVYRMSPSHSTRLSAEWLQFWRDINPEFKDDILDTLITDNFAWTNNTADIPAFDQSRLCGGALVKGSVVDGYLYIDGLLTSEPVPDAAIILNEPGYWYYGTEVNPHGVVTYITRTAKDGTRKPVRVPILSRLPLYVPLSWLHKLPQGYDPANHDSLRIWA